MLGYNLRHKECETMVEYYKLFDMLKRRNMKLSDLRNVISSATVAKLNKGQHISGECIDKICRYLQCQPSDIMEIVESESERLKREKFENTTNTMCESLYELLLKLSDNSEKTLSELWNEYLTTQSDKKKESADFRIMQKYIENRIAENETK